MNEIREIIFKAKCKDNWECVEGNISHTHECLPYYRIEKTQEGKEFFFSNVGYFNFWDMYLILKKDDVVGVYAVLFSRNDIKFHGQISYKQKINMINSIANSVYFKKPEEMFGDFPEMIKFDYLKEYSIYSLAE